MEKEIFSAVGPAPPQKDPIEVTLLTQDEYQLGQLGYKQEFYRHLGLFESWAATFITMSKCIQGYQISALSVHGNNSDYRCCFRYPGSIRLHHVHRWTCFCLYELDHDRWSLGGRRASNGRDCSSLANRRWDLLLELPTWGRKLGPIPKLADGRMLLFQSRGPTCFSGIRWTDMAIVVELGRLGLRPTWCATRRYELFAGGTGDPVP